MKFVIDLTVPDKTDPIEMADWLIDLLCDQEQAPYDSCDEVEPMRDSDGNAR